MWGERERGRGRRGGGEEVMGKVTKMTMLPKLIYKFNATSIKILDCF